MSTFHGNIQNFEDKINNIARKASDIPDWELILVEYFKGLVAEIKDFNNPSQKIELLKMKSISLEEKCSKCAKMCKMMNWLLINHH